MDARGYGEKADLVKKVTESYHLPVKAAEDLPPPPPPAGGGDMPNLDNIPGADISPPPHPAPQSPRTPHREPATCTHLFAAAGMDAGRMEEMMAEMQGELPWPMQAAA